MTLAYKRIVFLPLLTEHHPLLLCWLARPYVKEWWDDGDDTLEKVVQHYASETETERFLIGYRMSKAESAIPIGYIQSYPLADGGRGLDLFLGEERFLNRGVGTEVLHAFIHEVIARHDPVYLLVDPQPENARAIRCYEKAGFRHDETVTDDKGQLAYLMRLNRRRVDRNHPSI
jgi:RimJ/RimL family protein N-acetyltransferase